MIDERKTPKLHLFSSDSSTGMYTFISSYQLLASNWISQEHCIILSSWSLFPRTFPPPPPPYKGILIIPGFRPETQASLLLASFFCSSYPIQWQGLLILLILSWIHSRLFISTSTVTAPITCFLDLALPHLSPCTYTCLSTSHLPYNSHM